ncbi:MAG: hypothetical protein ACLQB1_07805 [Streptosporangiaceae bacterium]
MATAVLLGMAATAQAATGFQVQASSNVSGSDFDELSGVADTGFFDVAVGSYRISGQTLFHALALRFNGRTWSQVTVPVPAGDNTALQAVTTVTSANNWAVGSDANHSLIEHQNNSSSWSLVPSPANEPVNGVLEAVSATSANDIWAVGDSRAGTVEQGFEPLIEHWNGTAWSVVPGAPIAITGSDFLSGVAAVSADDVWAVGRTGEQSTPLIEHWNGTTWTRVAQPVSGVDSSLNSVAAISATDAWAVGEQNLNQTVIEHWNGTAWSVVPSPSVTASGVQDFLGSVSEIGSSDVWAVGFTSNLGTDQTLAEHWDGTSWQIVPSANPGPGSTVLNSLAQTAPGGPLRAVGFSTGGTPATATLVETTVG